MATPSQSEKKSDRTLWVIILGKAIALYCNNCRESDRILKKRAIA
ncbi:hypothetical protein [Planktothrix serta]|nr:hypothetical protein [Planktothrix serta]